MNETTKKKRAQLKVTDPAEAFRLDLEHGSRFHTTTGSLAGHPVSKIEAMNRGLLPEPYHAAAEDAVYAVYHYETPILWRVADGTWFVPMHMYSVATSRLRTKMTDAVKLFNGIIEYI